MKTLMYTFVKYSILLLLLCLSQTKMQAQIAGGSIVMKTKSMSDNKEIMDMMRFNDMEYYDVNFEGSNLKGKGYSITVKEIWNGKVKNTDTIFNSATGELAALGNLQADTLQFRVVAAKKGNDKLKIHFYFDRFGLIKEYKCTTSNSYSLRDVGTYLPIQLNKPFYAFAYILPYQLKDGGSSWCAVESSGRDIEKWGKEFDIKHYLLIEMNFFNTKNPTLVSKN